VASGLKNMEKSSPAFLELPQNITWQTGMFKEERCKDRSPHKVVDFRI
jgi:hypothetical protein